MNKSKNKYSDQTIEESMLPFSLKKDVEAELISSLLSSYQSKLRKVLRKNSKSRN